MQRPNMALTQNGIRVIGLSKMRDQKRREEEKRKREKKRKRKRRRREEKKRGRAKGMDSSMDLWIFVWNFV